MRPLFIAATLCMLAACSGNAPPVSVAEVRCRDAADAVAAEQFRGYIGNTVRDGYSPGLAFSDFQSMGGDCD